LVGRLVPAPAHGVAKGIRNAGDGARWLGR